MEIFAHIITGNNKHLSIDHNLNVISQTAINLADDMSYTRFTSISTKRMRTEVVHNEKIKELGNIKEIFIKNVYLIDAERSEQYIGVDTKSISTTIAAEEKDISYNMKNLPKNFCTLNTVAVNIDKIIKSSIVLKENSLKVSNQLSFNDFSYVVGFNFNKDDINIKNDTYVAYASKEEAKYIREYYHLENKTKFIKDCK